MGAFPKSAGVGLTIEVEILALLEGLKQLRVIKPSGKGGFAICHTLGKKEG